MACIVAFTLGTCLSIFNVAYVQVGGVHAVRGGTCTQPAEQVARPQSDTNASLRHSGYTSLQVESVVRKDDVAFASQLGRTEPQARLACRLDYS